MGTRDCCIFPVKSVMIFHLASNRSLQAEFPFTGLRTEPAGGIQSRRDREPSRIQVQGNPVPTPIKRIFIIDDDESFRQLIYRHLTIILPEAEIDACDPTIDPGLLDECNWQDYDLVILDYLLGDRLTGLDLLKKWKKIPGFPPVIMLTAAGSEEVAVRAMKSGIDDYISKQHITRERLETSIHEAISAHQRDIEHQQSNSQNTQSFNKTLFYKKLEEPIEVRVGEHGPVLVLLELDNYEVLGEEVGIVTQDNVVRHIAKVAFETFKDTPYQPLITRITDMAVAMLLQTTADTSLPGDMANLTESLIGNPYEYDDNLIPYTVSIGVVRLQDVPRKVSEIIKHGREACGVVRSRGGNGYHIFTPRTENKTAAPVATPKAGAGEKKNSIEQPEKPAPAKPTAPGGKTSDTAVKKAPEDKPVADKEKKVSKEPVSEKSLFELTLEMPSEQGQAKNTGNESTADGLGADTAGDQPAENDFDILQAFDDNRVLQYYQPVMPLSDRATESSGECFSVCVRLVNTDGSLIDADQVIKGLKHARNQKLVDRWMLRETVGRVVQFKQKPDQDYQFIIKLCEESFADTNLFNWLQNKLMKRVAKYDPGRSIIIEVNADAYLSKQKQITALMKFLSSNYDFRFAISGFKDIAQLKEIISNSRFNIVMIPHKLLQELLSAQSDSSALPLVVAEIKQQGGLVVATFLENAIMLTESINAGADFGMGYFIGEPVERIGELSQIESFEIT